MHSIIKLAIAVAICSTIFADRTVFCSRSGQTAENESVIEYAEIDVPTDSSKDNTAQVEETASSVEYSECVSDSKVIEAPKKKDVVKNKRSGCICRDAQEESTVASVIETPAKVDQPKLSKTEKTKPKKYKVVSVALPADAEPEAEAIIEAAVSGVSNSKSDSTELATSGDVLNIEEEQIDNLKGEQEEQKEEQEEKPKEEKSVSKKKDQYKKDRYANDKKRSKRDASGKKSKSEKSHKKGQNKDNKRKKSKGTKGKK